jgi:hypothetical protein
MHTTSAVPTPPHDRREVDQYRIITQEAVRVASPT